MQALSQFGENYELISYVLPGRDRKACKNKFKAEDKRNPSRINFCLKNRRPYGVTYSFPKRDGIDTLHRYSNAVSHDGERLQWAHS